MTLSAPELYAMAHMRSCGGPDRCHWCASPCERKEVHDDIGVQPFYLAPINNDNSVSAHRIRTTARCPGNQFICVGCWLFRRKRVSINFLDGEIRDGKEASDFSWWIDTSGGWALRKESSEQAYDKLLHPPHRFILALINKFGNKNGIHLAHANDLLEIKADTPLFFTLNNYKMEYTIFELEEGLKRGPESRSPGVRALIEFFGPYHIPLTSEESKEDERRKRGRPTKKDPSPQGIQNLRRVVTGRSG